MRAMPFGIEMQAGECGRGDGDGGEDKVRDHVGNRFPWVQCQRFKKTMVNYHITVGSSKVGS
jgi:hypothetical protein